MSFARGARARGACGFAFVGWNVGGARLIVSFECAHMLLAPLGGRLVGFFASVFRVRFVLHSLWSLGSVRKPHLALPSGTMDSSWQTSTVVKRWRALQVGERIVWKLRRIEMDVDLGEVVETWQKSWRSAAGGGDGGPRDVQEGEGPGHAAGGGDVENCGVATEKDKIAQRQARLLLPKQITKLGAVEPPPVRSTQNG